MLGFFGPEDVDFVGIKHDLLTFRSKKRKQKAGTRKVRLGVPIEGTLQPVTLSVTLSSMRPVLDGSWICTGRISEAPQQLEHLQVLLADAVPPDLGVASRRSERVSFSIRILSPELPGYRCVTGDVSLHGALLLTEEAVDPGTYMNLQLELDMSTMPTLTVQAVAVWCAAGQVRKQFKVGVEFTQQHPETHAAWERYYSFLRARQQGSVLQRAVMDGDFLIREHQERTVDGGR